MKVWLLSAVLFLGLIALNVSFVMFARAIRRDVTRRFDDLERRLESRAQAIVDHLFNANRN